MAKPKGSPHIPEMVERLPNPALNARLTYSTDAVGTWIFIMDTATGEPLPLRVFGPDQAGLLDRVLSVLAHPPQ